MKVKEFPKVIKYTKAAKAIIKAIKTLEFITSVDATDTDKLKAEKARKSVEKYIKLNIYGSNESFYIIYQKLVALYIDAQKKHQLAYDICIGFSKLMESFRLSDNKSFKRHAKYLKNDWYTAFLKYTNNLKYQTDVYEE